MEYKERWEPKNWCFWPVVLEKILESLALQGDQTIQYHGNPSLCPNSNTEEAEVEWFYKNLQDLLELTPKNDVLFIIGDWNGKLASQETPGVTGKFGFGVRNEAGQRLIDFCQENTLVITNPFPTT